MNSVSFLSILFICLIQLSANGQTDNAFRTISGDQVLIKTNDKIEGNPYLFQDWSSATIIDMDGNKLKDELLNYDCVREKFLVKSNGSYIALDKYKYSEVQVFIDNGVTSFLNIIYDGEVFFAECLFKGENTDLLVKHFGDKNFTNTNNYNDVSPRYTISKKTQYYLKLGKVVYAISKKENDILAILKNDNLKPYIKKNKLKVKKQKDLIGLIQYFDSL